MRGADPRLQMCSPYVPEVYSLCYSHAKQRRCAPDPRAAAARNDDDDDGAAAVAAAWYAGLDVGRRACMNN